MNEGSQTAPKEPNMTTTLQSPQTRKTLNGIDPDALRRLAGHAAADPRNAQVKFNAATHWRGGTKSETHIDGYELGGKRVAKDFTITVDEPRELVGGNTAPNPQEVLLTSLNSCMLVGYVAGATLHGVTLESLSIESEGQLDMRGFLGLDANVKPGYDEIRYTVRIKGD